MRAQWEAANETFRAAQASLSDEHPGFVDVPFAVEGWKCRLCLKCPEAVTVAFAIDYDRPVQCSLCRAVANYDRPRPRQPV